MRPTFYFLVGLALALFFSIPFAHAGTDTVPSLATISRDKVLQKYYPIDSLGNLRVETPKPITLGTAAGARVPVTIDAIGKRVLSKDLLAKAAAKSLRGGVIGTVGAVASVVDALDLHYDPACNCIVQGTESTQSPTSDTTVISTQQVEYYPGYSQCGYSTPGQGFATALAACQCAQPLATSPTPTDVTQATGGYCYGHTTTSGANVEPWGSYWSRNYCPQGSTWNGSACVQVTQSCPSGFTLENGVCVEHATQKTEEEVKDLIKLHDFDPPPFFDDLLADDDIDASEAPYESEVKPTPNTDTTVTPTGPNSYDAKSPKRVTDRGDGTRAEEQTTAHITTNGDTINYTITNTTNIINNTTGQVVDSSTETNSGGSTSTQPDSSYTDTPLPENDLLVQMPEVPDFYVQKYPDGFATPWDTFKQGIDQTSFKQLLNQMTPSWSGGECPVWQLNMDMGIANYGTMTIEPPCWLFPILKVILIVTALFVARGLVFGG